MKTNGSASGGLENEVKGKLKTDCYSKLFPLMNGFLLYMAQNNAPIDIVSIQNETDWWVDYSGCLYSPQEMHDLVASAKQKHHHLYRRTRQTLWGECTDANLKTVAKRYMIEKK